jgi:polyisoprenoid-binding protein YceI
MLRLFVLVFAALALSARSSEAVSVAVDPKQVPAGSYEVEPRHTQVVFAISHFGLTDFYGRFDKVSGTLSFNPTALSNSAVSISIDTASVDTPNAQLNSEIQAPAIFDSAHFPAATFKSTSIARTGPNSGRITGDLTLKGITKPVTLEVTYNGGLKSPMGGSAYLIGFHATTTIRRSDFNMTSTMWSPLVGDDAKLTVEALFVQTKE